MQFLIFASIALLLGAITPIYLSMNSSVARHVGSPFLANVSFFLVALTTATLIVFVIFLTSMGQQVSLVGIATKFRNVPPQYYLSGMFSALFILGTATLIPRLGASMFFVLFVSGQVLMAVIISHFGILESPQDPISIPKLIGVFLVISGVIMTTILKDSSWITAAFRNLSSLLNA